MYRHTSRLAREVPQGNVDSANDPHDTTHGPAGHGLPDLFTRQRVPAYQHRLKSINDHPAVVTECRQGIAKKSMPLNTFVGDDPHQSHFNRFCSRAFDSKCVSGRWNIFPFPDSDFDISNTHWIHSFSAP